MNELRDSPIRAHPIWLKILPISHPRTRGLCIDLRLYILGWGWRLPPSPGIFEDVGPLNAGLGPRLAYLNWDALRGNEGARCAMLAGSDHPGHGHQGAAPGCASLPHFLPPGSAGGTGPHLAQWVPGSRAAPAIVPLGLAWCLHTSLGLRTPVPPCPPQARLQGVRRPERGLEASPRARLPVRPRSLRTQMRDPMGEP